MKSNTFLVLWFLLSVSSAVSVKQEKQGGEGENKSVSRQFEYVSLLNSLLQQTNILSSVDGVLLAFTTVIATLMTRIKPLLIASSFSYLTYIGAAMLFPASLKDLGLPPLEIPRFNTTGRSVDGGARMLDGTFTESFTKGLKLSPITTIVTNVTVTVITETMSSLRLASRIMAQQLTLLQGNMHWLGRMLSIECVSRFMCRVGQFTETNFPAASALLRTVADTYPKMDELAVAVVRGTSSSNCSFIYPDCPV